MTERLGLAAFVVLVSLVLLLVGIGIDRENRLNIERERTKQETVRACHLIEDEVTLSRCVREVGG